MPDFAFFEKKLQYAIVNETGFKTIQSTHTDAMKKIIVKINDLDIGGMIIFQYQNFIDQKV